jgi:hypothetical protein
MRYTPRMKTLTSVLVTSLSLVGAVAQAAGTAKVVSAKVTVGHCSTDGGTTSCPTGVKWLGEVLSRQLNDALSQTPVTCDKGGTVKAWLEYGYNDGSVFVGDEAKLPPCMQGLMKTWSANLLEYWKTAQKLDPTIDMNSRYDITFTVK